MTPPYKVTRVKAPTFEIAETVNPLAFRPKDEPVWTDEEKAAMQVFAHLARKNPDRLHQFVEAAGVWSEVCDAFQPLEVAQPPDYSDPVEPDYQPKHEVHLREVPIEARQRVMMYLRRRFEMSLQDAKRVVNTPGFVLRRGMSRPEAEDLIPDLIALGVTAEVVVGEDVR